MNQRLIEIYRSCRAKEALASQDQYKSANVLIGSEVEKFAELIVRDVIGIVEGYCETSPEIYGLPLEILEHFDMELTKE